MKNESRTLTDISLSEKETVIDSKMYSYYHHNNQIKFSLEASVRLSYLSLILIFILLNIFKYCLYNNKIKVENNIFIYLRKGLK